MDQTLKQIYDTWTQTFAVKLMRCWPSEHERFKVLYEQEGRVKSHFVRYDRIAHAVETAV